MSIKPKAKSGRPSLPPELRRVSLSLWVFARHAEMLKIRAARAGHTPARELESIMDELPPWDSDDMMRASGKKR